MYLTNMGTMLQIPFSFERFLEITTSILTALGIGEIYKLWFRSKIEDQIESRRFGIKEKREIRENLLSTFASAKQGHWRRLPEPSDLAHLHKMIFKVQGFNGALAKELKAYLALWTFFIYQPYPLNAPDKDKRSYLNIEKKLDEINNTVVPKIEKLWR